MSATPRTDEAWAKRFDYHDISPWSLCMKLEIELAEADQKWERRLIAALGGHADSKLWGDDGLIAATWRCVKGYEKMEKQLAEARMTIDDVCCVIAKEHEGPRLAAMRIVDELSEARKQRDTLAEALKIIATHNHADGQCDNGYSPQYIAKQALATLQGGEA
jgi:hypothetical protein